MPLGSCMVAAPLPWRWVYVSRNLTQDQDVADIERIVNTAAEHGLNGMVLTGSFDALDLRDAAYFARLEQVKAICAARKIEIIPTLFTAGYGGGILSHNRNLAAGLPVQNALFEVQDGEARVVADPPVAILNGDFETFTGDRMAEYRFHDEPGVLSFADTDIFHSGKASLRFEEVGRNQHGHGRVMQEVTVAPHRQYRVRVWLKTEKLDPADSLNIQVYSQDRNIASRRPTMKPTQDWKEWGLEFNSLEATQVRIYVGLWGGKTGKLWVDDLSIEEVGPLNILHRPGTPVHVTRADTGEVCEAGRDYELPVDEKLLNRDPTREAPSIKIPPGSRLHNGDRLRVSYYHAVIIGSGQVSICMSEPEVYEIWETQSRLLHEHLAPTKFLLSMDEIRAGGSCAACKARGMTMGEILGDCITKQVALLRKYNPGCEVLCWSDMLDPNHNAHGNYYMVDGDFTGSWEHVPKDLILACWYYSKREASLAFFAERGFRTFGAAYYDGDDLTNPQGWLESLHRTPKALGIMYTTWRNKYDLLAAFGDLVSQ
ncbi:MAG: hypothetical protein ACUVX8_00590 [Candidatus Zipacnadales bacterium]